MGIEAVVVTMLPMALARLKNYDSEQMAAATVEALNGPMFTAEDREKIAEVLRLAVAKLPPAL